MDLTLLPFLCNGSNSASSSPCAASWGRDDKKSSQRAMGKVLGSSDQEHTGWEWTRDDSMLLISFYPWFPLAAICFLSTCSTSVWYLDLYQEIVFSVLTQKCVTPQKYSMYTYASVGSLANRVFLGCPATKKIEDTREVTTVMRNISFLTPLCCNSP